MPSTVPFPNPPPCKELLLGTVENKSVVQGRALFINLQVILQLGGCWHWGYVRRTAWQSNNVIPAGSAGLGETCEEVAGPVGFQGNLISSTSAPQKARAGT